LALISGICLLSKQVFKILQLTLQDLIFRSQGSVVQFKPGVLLCLFFELELDLV
jgi:hypothetical protein